MPSDQPSPPSTGVVGEHHLTYAQIATRLAISTDAARLLVRRRGWRRITPNRLGAPAIIIIPDEALAAEDWRDRPTPGGVTVHDHTSPEVTTDHDLSTPGVAATIDAVLSALREAHAGEIERLAGIHGAEVDRLTEALAAERSRIDALIDSHRGEIVAIEAKLSAVTARADDVAAQATGWQEAKEAARKEVHEMANRVMVLQRDADRSEAEVAALTDENSALKVDLTVARADGTTMAIEAKRLHGDLQDAQAAAQTAQERLAAQDRAEAARRARGLLARLRDALRGQ
jgi:hypothetical protein